VTPAIAFIWDGAAFMAAAGAVMGGRMEVALIGSGAELVGDAPNTELVFEGDVAWEDGVGRLLGEATDGEGWFRCNGVGCTGTPGSTLGATLELERRE
jgi:hypothetical protein